MGQRQHEPAAIAFRQCADALAQKEGVWGAVVEESALRRMNLALGDRLKAATDLPVLMGFGVSAPEQALTLSEHADGVIVASALMRRFLDGDKPADVAALVAEIRTAFDAAPGPR